MIELPSPLMTPPLITGILLIFSILCYKWTYKSRFWKFWISLGIFCLVYTLLVGAVVKSDIEIKNEYEKFDLNKDGVYSSDEITVEYEKASDSYIHDTGRNFVVIIGAFFSGIISLITYLVLWGYQKYQRLKLEETTTHVTVAQPHKISGKGE